MSPVCTCAPPAAADDEPARGLAAGDETCLAVAYERWSALVHALARRSLGDTAEAEDVTRHVLLGVWRGRHGYRPERGAVGAWIVGITRRRIADALSARTCRADLAVSAGTASALAGGSPGRGEDSEAALDRVLIRSEPARLPAPQRRILHLAFYEDLTQTQIADRTGPPPHSLHERCRSVQLAHVALNPGHSSHRKYGLGRAERPPAPPGRHSRPGPSPAPHTARSRLSALRHLHIKEK